MFLLLALSCNDYNLHTKAAGLSGAGGALSWTPEAVDAGSQCGPTTAAVTYTNVGDAVLTVEEIAATGWAIDDAPETPLRLQPAGELVVSVRGSGAGTLSVHTDLNDTPVAEVPLDSLADTPPSVEITAPTDGTILEIGGSSTLTASATDAEDADLEVSWRSDADGPLGSGPSLAWDAADQSSGSHTITASVTDSCGQQAEAAIAICQDEGYIEESLDLSSWNFEGSARYDSAGYVVLTEATTNQSGTAFQTYDTVASDEVTIAFSFYMGDGTGADGLSMTVLDTERMDGFVGDSGGGIGFRGLPGWSIEVDTWFNDGDGNDPTAADHVALHIDGGVQDHVLWSALPEMEDTGWHEMVVTASGGWLTVSIDSVTYIDGPAALDAFPAYVGFTGATGAVTNNHRVDALLVTGSVCEDG